MNKLLIKSDRKGYYSKNLSILNISLYIVVIETSFEMLKYSKHEKLWRYSNYSSEVRSADPPFSFSLNSKAEITKK